MVLFVPVCNSPFAPFHQRDTVIGGVQVTSLHRDPIGVDNRSLGAKN